MLKKRILIWSVIAVILSLIVYLNYAFILSLQANPMIKVDGIKLMMDEENVINILGNDGEIVHGFGGYFIEYPSNGIFLTFLNDPDTDFYKKVNAIKITGLHYEIYGLKVGDDFKSAASSLRKKGFKQEEGYEYGFRKSYLYVILNKNGEKIESIIVGIKDRVSSNRIY